MSGSPSADLYEGRSRAEHLQRDDDGASPFRGREWTVSELAEALVLDQRTVRKRLLPVPPVRTTNKQRFYSLPDAVRALFGHPTLQAEAELRHRTLTAAAEKAELGVKARRGELVDRAETKRDVLTAARAERDAWLSWAMRRSSPLAAELGADPGRTFAALDRETRDHLRWLSDPKLGVLG